ncbi:MAG: DUF2335 domain-containing protein [Hyphomicrobiaceae bacterium]|nr:DUF2335 domain-containing protein [Hyphomicrobiaceae bacterium]
MKKPRKPRSQAGDVSKKDQEIEVDQPSAREERVVSVRTEWVAPLPPPATMAEYDVLVTNGAERIFEQFEKEASHRRDLESRSFKAEMRDLLIGKVFAFLFAVSALGVSAYAVKNGAEWVGAVIGGGVIGTVVLAFMKQNGSTSRDDE